MFTFCPPNAGLATLTGSRFATPLRRLGTYSERSLRMMTGVSEIWIPLRASHAPHSASVALRHRAGWCTLPSEGGHVRGARTSAMVAMPAPKRPSVSPNAATELRAACTCPASHAYRLKSHRSKPFTCAYVGGTGGWRSEPSQTTKGACGVLGRGVRAWVWCRPRPWTATRREALEANPSASNVSIRLIYRRACERPSERLSAPPRGIRANPGA